MASNNSTATPDNKTIIDDITIGVVVILIGAIVYIGWILYKRRRRRRRKRNRKGSESVLEPMVEMEEMNIETPPKKTAADHLGELREVTQKVLQPLRISSSFSSPKENLSTVLSSGSSVSSNNTKRDNKISTLKDSLIFKPFKVPSPPPPSPLRNDDIKVEPIRLSLLNLLLSNESTNTSSSISSPIVDSSSDLSLPAETNSKNDSLHSLRKTLSKSQPDLSNISRTVTTLPRETNSKKNLLRKSISNSHPDLKDLSRKKLPQLDLTSPPKIHSKKGPLSQLDLTPSSRTIPQLNSTIPSESRYKWDLKRTTPILDSKVQSKRSNRQTYSRNKETNDYTNFQPIQNIKPVQNAQSEKTAKITKIVETEEVEELTLSPMYRIVKPVLKKERQDDEIILDATLE